MSAVHLTLAHWVYLIGVLAVIATMLFRSNVVVPSVLATFFVATAITSNPVTGIVSVFNASFVAAKELFNIFLVIAFMTALLGALKAVGADVRMVQPFRRIMRGGFSSYLVLGAVTYGISMFFWPTPAVPLVCAVLLPAAIAAGLPPLVGAAVVAIAGQGMALSSDYVIRVAPGISAKAAGVGISADAVANKAMILSWIVGIIALVLVYLKTRKTFKKADVALLDAWQNEIGSSAFQPERAGTFEKEHMAEIMETPADDLSPQTEARQHMLRCGHRFAWITPLVFAVVIVLLAMPVFFPKLGTLRGGDAAGLVGGAGFLLMMAVCFCHVGARKTMELCPDYMIDGFVFAFKAMGVVLPIAGFFFLGVSETTAQIVGLPADTAPSLLFELVRAAQNFIPNNAVMISIGELIIGMITGLDGSGFSGLPLTGSLAGAFGPTVGMNVETLAAIGQMGAIWTGGGTLIAWSSLIAVAGFARVSVMELVRLMAMPVILALLIATVIGAVFL